MSIVSFAGLDPFAVVHALYHGTRPLGFGKLHDQPSLSLQQVTRECNAFGWPDPGWQNRAPRKLNFDYYHGRPLKVALNLEEETFESALYDRDAGQGAAQRVVDRLRDQSSL